MSENMTGATKAFPVIPLDDAVVLPGMVVPLDLNDSETRAAVDAAANGPTRGGKPQVLLVPRLDGTYAKSGVVAIIEQTGRMAGSGRMVAVVRGTHRATIGVGTTGPGAALWVEAIVLEEPSITAKTRELAKEYKDLAIEILQHREAFQVVDMVQQISDPSQLADSAGYAPYLKAVQKVELLETLSVDERLQKLLTWGREHLVELDVNETIRKDVEDGMEKQQREFLLRRQLSAIRKELAELDGKEASEEEDYRSRVETADLPDKVREAALKEVDKLERSGDQNPEAGWIRTWLDTVLEMPWSERSEDSYDIAGARAVLDADHAGLDDVKERIVEYLAVRKKRQDKGLELVGGRRSGAVLALVGPPGVGKTSLGESVARAMGRKFVRVALGGVRDEAEIRGHRRTYVGALPGRIVRAIKDAGTMNPVVLLDEIDKVGADYRGDPTAALLEVLDPAQNHTFRDHYLEVELDLSDVVFLATANVLVSTDEVAFDDEALRLLAQQYTREAGVRDLERAISRVLRKVAAKTALADSEAAAKSKATVLDQDSANAVEVTAETAVAAETEATAESELTSEATPEGSKTKLIVTVENLKDYLGRPRHTPETADRLAVPGVATGLAVTGAGGEVLFVEASLSDPETGGTGVTLTGQLGDVMKESAQIALSYLRSHGAELELPVADLSKRAVHVHVPAGAQPKDGPSAGVTMTTALASLLSGRLVRKDVAMTGEVSLTGRVLPIGGVKQKLLAAHQAGATTVLLPKRNGPDLDDVPAEVLDKLTVHLVADVREVLDLALEPAERPVAVAAV
jgi:ATP-dependent Lon protease